MRSNTIITALLILLHFSLISQTYETINVANNRINKGTVSSSDLPFSAPKFTFFKQKRFTSEAVHDSNIVLTTNKVVLFRISLKDYSNSDHLFIEINNKITSPVKSKQPLITAFFDTCATPKMISENYYSYYHTSLNEDHHLSVQAHPNLRYFYIVIALSDSFDMKFDYSISFQIKPFNTKRKYYYGHALYRHPYDYENKPPFFMESAFYMLLIPYDGIVLNEKVFKKPHLKTGNDSLFYNEWMTNFTNLAKNDTTMILYCDPPKVKLEIHFDSKGLITLRNALFQFEYEFEKQESDPIYIRLLKESFPKNYYWTPAIDFNGRPVDYNFPILFRADFCWN